MANIFGSFRITSRFTVSTWKKRNVNLKFFGKIYSFMESWKKKPNSLRSEIFGGQNSFLKTPGCSALLLNMAPSPGFFKFLILSQGRRFFFFFKAGWPVLVESGASWQQNSCCVNLLTVFLWRSKEQNNPPTQNQTTTKIYNFSMVSTGKSDNCMIKEPAGKCSTRANG